MGSDSSTLLVDDGEYIPPFRKMFIYRYGYTTDGPAAVRQTNRRREGNFVSVSERDLNSLNVPNIARVAVHSSQIQILITGLARVLVKYESSPVIFLNVSFKIIFPNRLPAFIK